MAYLYIRGIGPKMRREIKRRAHAHGRAVEDEVQLLLEVGLNRVESRTKLRKAGTKIKGLVQQSHVFDDVAKKLKRLTSI